jgi:hypothetical protein
MWLRFPLSIEARIGGRECNHVTRIKKKTALIINQIFYIYFLFYNFSAITTPPVPPC